jgi:hypothetical protein
MQWAAWQGPGRRMPPCWVLLSLPGRPTPSSFPAAAVGPACACGEARNRAVNCGRKWMGASRLECASPTAPPGWQLYLTACWTFGRGGRVGLEGEVWRTYMEARHGAANGRPKVNGGHVTGACWAPRAVHRDRRIHCTCHLYWDPRGCHRGHQHTKPAGYGVGVLNCMQELKNRPFRTATNGLKWAAGHVLVTFSTLQWRPTCRSLINDNSNWIYM